MGSPSEDWMKHGNLREGGKANWDLWVRLLEAMEKHKVFWIWIKAHNGHPENEIVDGEAKKASRRYYADAGDQRRTVPNYWE